MMLKQTLLFNLMLLFLSMHSFAQTPLGYFTDVDGNPVNGISSAFNQNHTNKIVISNTLDGYNWGKIILKDKSVKTGLVKVVKEAVYFKIDAFEYANVTTYKAKNVAGVIVATDAFLKAENIKVGNRLIKETFVKYLFSFDGKEYGEYYHVKTNSIKHEIYAREIGTEQWKRLDYKNKLLLEHFFGYDSLSDNAIKSFDINSKQKEFQKGFLTLETNKTYPVYFRIQGRKLFYKKSITAITEEESQPTSIKCLTTNKDSIVIIDSYTSYSNVDNREYHKKGEFFAKVVMSNDSLNIVQTLGSSPITLQSLIGENKWKKMAL